MSADFAGAAWRKSRRSNQEQACVELAKVGPTVGVRDSKFPEIGHLELAPTSFRRLLGRVKSGELGR